MARFTFHFFFHCFFFYDCQKASFKLILTRAKSCWKKKRVRNGLCIQVELKCYFAAEKPFLCDFRCGWYLNFGHQMWSNESNVESDDLNICFLYFLFVNFFCRQKPFKSIQIEIFNLLNRYSKRKEILIGKLLFQLVSCISRVGKTLQWVFFLKLFFVCIQYWVVPMCHVEKYCETKPNIFEHYLINYIRLNRIQCYFCWIQSFNVS